MHVISLYNLRQCVMFNVVSESTLVELHSSDQIIKVALMPVADGYFYRGHSISSLLVPEYSYYVGFKGLNQCTIDKWQNLMGN
jgi:hypothetical protein